MRSGTTARGLLIAMAALLLVPSAGGPQARTVALAPGEPAPALQGVTYPDRERWRADWSQHTLTLVNFWASWCLPCKEEMPKLQALHERFEEDGLLIVGVFEPPDTAQARALLRELGIDYTNIRAPESVDIAWGGVAIKPTTFLIDQEGKVLRRYIGTMPEAFLAMIEDLEAVLEGLPLPDQFVPTAKTQLLEPEGDVPEQKIPE